MLTWILPAVVRKRVLLSAVCSATPLPLLKVRLKMADFKSKALTAEELIATLRDQVDQLQGFLDQNGSHGEQDEIAKLKGENDKLKKDINQLKFDLEFLEVQNGVAVVPLPGNQGQGETASQVVTAEPLKEEKPRADGNQGKQAGKNTIKEKTKGDKKDNSKKESTGKGEDDNKPVDCSRLNLKIGKIVNAKLHPDADALYVEEVDLGEEKNRTILSGLVKHVPMEEMQGKIAVFMCNLKPSKIRGIISEGMIMCAISPDKTEIIKPPEGSSPGDIVYFEGYQGEPDRQLNPKRKIWEQVQPDLGINSDGIPHYKGAPMTVQGKGICKAPSVKNCMIR